MFHSLRPSLCFSLQLGRLHLEQVPLTNYKGSSLSGCYLLLLVGAFSLLVAVKVFCPRCVPSAFGPWCATYLRGDQRFCRNLENVSNYILIISKIPKNSHKQDCDHHLTEALCSYSSWGRCDANNCKVGLMCAISVPKRL